MEAHSLPEPAPPHFSFTQIERDVLALFLSPFYHGGNWLQEFKEFGQRHVLISSRAGNRDQRSELLPWTVSTSPEILTPACLARPRVKVDPLVHFSVDKIELQSRKGLFQKSQEGLIFHQSN